MPMNTQLEGPPGTGRPPIAKLAWTAAVTIAAIAGCGDGNPTGPAETRVQSVALTSPVDTIMAAGRSAQLAAVVRDDRGATVTNVPLTWSSSNEGVAAVTNAGVVEALEPGTTTISATTGTVTGSLTIRVVEVDLAAITALLADPYATALVGALGQAPRTRVQSAITACASARDSGNVVAMGECLASIAGEAATVTGATDRALAAMLGLFALKGEQSLGL